MQLRELGRLPVLNVSSIRVTVSVFHTVIASPSIFANGVDHFRSVLDDVEVNDEDHRIVHCAERRESSLGRD
jgi:hypothetical protein